MKTTETWSQLDALRVLGDWDHPCSAKHRKQWRETIRAALEKAGSVADAAKILKVPRSTFFRLVGKYPELTAGIALRRHGWSLTVAKQAPRKKPEKAAKPKPKRTAREIPAKTERETPRKPPSFEPERAIPDVADFGWRGGKRPPPPAPHPLPYAPPYSPDRQVVSPWDDGQARAFVDRTRALQECHWYRGHGNP